MLRIAFTGQDGSGKSTQISLLRKRLEALGLRVSHVHQYEPVTSAGKVFGNIQKHLANRISRRQRTVRTASAGRRNGRQQSRISGVADLAVYPIAMGYLLVGLCRTWWNWTAHRSVDVMILDRFFSDEIVRASHKFGRGAGVGMWLLRYAAPRPSLMFSFTVEPTTGWSRKKTREMDIGEYTDKVVIIQRLLQQIAEVRQISLIPVDGVGAVEVAEAVWRQVEPCLPGSSK